MRFLSPDPVVDHTEPQQRNGYSYAHNNPTTFVDPTGLREFESDSGGWVETRRPAAPKPSSHFCDGCEYGGSGHHHYRPAPRHHGRICDGCQPLPKPPVVRAPKYDPYKCMFFTEGACTTLHRQGSTSGAPRRHLEPARIAATIYRYGPNGQLLDLASRVSGKTVGYCVNADAVGGVNGTGGVCYVSTPSGEAGFTATGGFGPGATIGASVTVGYTLSNAKKMSDLSKQFAYVWGSAGEGPASGTGSFAWGQNSEGKNIWQATVGASFSGNPPPVPFSFGGGTSYTWIAPSYR